MGLEKEQVKERMKLFRELIASVSDVYLTEYNGGFEVVESNSPYEDLFYLFFRGGETEEARGIPEYLKQEEPLKASNGPAIFTNSMGFTWLSDTEIREGRLHRIYLMGPAFLDEYPAEAIRRQMERRKWPVSEKHRFMEAVKKIPMLSLSRFFEYGIMLHCCLTGERVGSQDFLYPGLLPNPKEDPEEDGQNSQMVENEILRLVEEGNLNYDQEMRRYISVNTGRLADQDAMRDMKNTVIVFTALCARAAIRGGLSPRIAHPLSHQYIRMAERAENFATLNEVNGAMLGDFIRRVHAQKRTMQQISPQIRESCEYISLHLSSCLDIHTLAARLGYTDYYFSSKFKKEVGMSVRDYIMKQKIERAKELLRGSTMDIQTISEQLGFASQSHFGEVFRDLVGESPGSYRSGKGE